MRVMRFASRIRVKQIRNRSNSYVTLKANDGVSDETLRKNNLQMELRIFTK